MDSTIIGAVITGIASIGAAWLARHPPLRRKSLSPEESARIAPRRWLIPCLLILAWMFYTPGWMHHDMSGSNFFFIPGFLVITALIWPIRPMTGAAIDLGLSALNFIAGPLSNILAGSSHDTNFFWLSNQPEDLPLIVGIVFGGAAVVWLVCLVRLYFRGGSNEEEVLEQSTSGSNGLAFDLAALAELRANGSLTEEEFAQSKARLLGR